MKNILYLCVIFLLTGCAEKIINTEKDHEKIIEIIERIDETIEEFKGNPSKYQIDRTVDLIKEIYRAQVGISDRLYELGKTQTYEKLTSHETFDANDHLKERDFKSWLDFKVDFLQQKRKFFAKVLKMDGYDVPNKN